MGKETPVGKANAAVPPAKGISGKNSNTRRRQPSLKCIVTRHDDACTAMALYTDAIADMAADTEDAQLVKVALYANRTASEWHRLGDILPTVLQLAIAASEAGQP